MSPTNLLKSAGPRRRLGGMSNPASYVRRRIVCLARDGSSKKAPEACATLRGVKGIQLAEPVNDYRLRLVYSLEQLSFELIEGLLRELGFKLDQRIFAMVRRSIYQYLEDTAREKMQLEDEKQELLCDVNPELPRDKPEKYWNRYR
jgi:hypothetical protein